MPRKPKDKRNTKKRKVETSENLCIVCGIDMGESNNRQLCGKTYCMYQSDFEDQLKDNPLDSKNSELNEKDEDYQPSANQRPSATLRPASKQRNRDTHKSRSDHESKDESGNKNKHGNKDNSTNIVNKPNKFDKLDKTGKPNKPNKFDVPDEPEEPNKLNKPSAQDIYSYKPRRLKSLLKFIKRADKWVLADDAQDNSSEDSEYIDDEISLGSTDSWSDSYDETDHCELCSLGNPYSTDIIPYKGGNNEENNSNGESIFDLFDKLQKTKEDSTKKYINNQYDPKTHKLEKDSVNLLDRIKRINEDKTPTFSKILNSSCNVETKALAIDYMVRVFNQLPELSEDWIECRDKINKIISNPNNLSDTDYTNYEVLMQNKYTPTIVEILNTNLSVAKKIELIDSLKMADNRHIHPMDAKKCIDKVRKELSIMKKLGDNLKDLADDEEKYLDKNMTLDINQGIEAEITKRYEPAVSRKIIGEYLRGLKLSADEKHKTIQWVKYVSSMPYDIKPFPISKQSSVEEFRDFEQMVRNKIDETVFGMEKVKNYIIDYIFQVVSGSDASNNILALCGPPGIGKTTIANVIAQCINLPFIPISVGGQGDASELKGHSRTYVRAVPGKIVQGLSGVEYKNTVIFIDEIDKISGRHENELSGVLTHILDPSSNCAFVDDYLGYPIDLSKSLFVLAFNNAEAINPILRDRMEIVQLSGYSLSEKISMTKSHLLPREMKRLGFNTPEKTTPDTQNTYQMSRQLDFTDGAIEKLITMSRVKEEGVRQLIRNLRGVLKKINRYILVRNEKFIRSTYFPDFQVYVIDSNIMEELFEENVKETNDHYKSLYI